MTGVRHKMGIDRVLRRLASVLASVAFESDVL